MLIDTSYMEQRIAELYEEEEVHLHFLGAEYDKYQSSAQSQDGALRSIEVGKKECLAVPDRNL